MRESSQKAETGCLAALKRQRPARRLKQEDYEVQSEFKASGTYRVRSPQKHDKAHTAKGSKGQALR